MFRYETHCHTAPVSDCARASVEETVRFYKEIGYDGIFLTNHFLDGNINHEVRHLLYAEQLEFYFSAVEEAQEIAVQIAFKVFPGVELSYKGTDFLIYGLDKEWYLQHPEIMQMEKREELEMMMAEGALVSHAHPYREDSYIDHIRLYPRSVEAVEIVNSNQPPLVNEMGAIYARKYGLLVTAGSDNHKAEKIFEELTRKGLEPEIAGMCAERPVESVEDFIRMVRTKELKPFIQKASGEWRLL